MKWSWKSFCLLLVITFLAATALSYVISLIIESPNIKNDGHLTRISMVAGGFFAPLLLAIIGGWKRWHLKMPLIIALIVSALFTSNPAAAMMTTLLAALFYHLAGKAKELVYYYQRPVPSVTREPTPNKSL